MQATTVQCPVHTLFFWLEEILGDFVSCNNTRFLLSGKAIRHKYNAVLKKQDSNKTCIVKFYGPAFIFAWHR